MLSEKQTKSKDKAAAKQRPAQLKPQYLEVASQPTHPSILIQRAKLHPSSLTVRDLLQLQRAVGNQTVSRLLASTVQSRPVQPKLMPVLDQVGEMSSQRHSQAPEMLQAIASKENKTGLPDNLKAGIENLSGMPMNNVKVHYNSSKPARLQALAYTQGTDIYVGPGQERHLAHEAWHVVQQKQGRVNSTLQAKGVAINDDQRLEQEADVMGRKAAGMERSDRAATEETTDAQNQGKWPLSFPHVKAREQGSEIQRDVPTGAPVQMVACQGTTHDTSNEHRLIEIDYMQNINPNAAREFEIPRGSLDTHENGTHKTGYADIADQATREIYEIKRADEAYPQAQLDRYLEAANASCGGGWTAGHYYPDERIIDFSHHDPGKELLALKDGRAGFIRYSKRNSGGGLGIAHAMGGGVYVRGMAAAAELPPLDKWVTIWTEYISDSADAPEQIDTDSAKYRDTVAEIQQTVQAVRGSLRGGTLDRDLLRNGWSRLRALIDSKGF
jgi:hypothetical protein